ncbi:protein PHLOEM PROTEIN 2-LIKE A10-like [Iris pallida]|uniref:Protein PHLOEM PROTEIN 2-LIKE A10-like n=1 Tax=Iris pallida TaxID=29817 RepID=A0AAX6HTY1_IRIPA|nr:protein PHLOEM PROTEIN 2-LIKE A10-like [Iris pallida]
MAETLTLTSMTEFLRRRRNWIVLLVGAGISGYGVYTLYHLPEVERRRRKLLSLLKILVSFADAVSSSAETVALLTSDLNSFLRSDSDEVPASLKQLSKLARSDEFAGSISRASEALTSGIVRGIGSRPANSASSSTSNLSDRVVDKVFSPSGTGFASVVVGSFARNLAVGFMHQEPGSPTATPAWLEMISSDRCRDLAASCIEKSVATLVAVYLEKTKGVNSFDELFAGITNPKHEAKAKDLVVSVCNGAVETLIRASHQAISGSNRVREENGCVEMNEVDDKEGDGWFDKVSSTLAVPSNRRLVLDVTGRVTFETVRSFLDFTLWKICVGAKRGAQVVGDGVAERGMEVVRYFSAKSMLVVTICLAMCMRVMAGTRVLMPA